MARKKKEEQYDWSQEAAGAGFENVNQEDLGVPFLAIIQKGSPEVDKSEDKYDEDLEIGDIVNSLTKDKYGSEDDPLEFIPCSFKKMYPEWRPDRGGFVQHHQDQSILARCVRNERGQDELSNGHVIVTTGYHFGIALVNGAGVNCVIGMSSTQLKKSRMWLNMMMSIKMDGENGQFVPPMFSHVYELSTIAESNDKGGWMGWKIEMGRTLNDAPMIERARSVSTSSTKQLPVSTNNGNDEEDGPTPF